MQPLQQTQSAHGAAGSLQPADVLAVAGAVAAVPEACVLYYGADASRLMPDYSCLDVEASNMVHASVCCYASHSHSARLVHALECLSCLACSARPVFAAACVQNAAVARVCCPQAVPGRPENGTSGPEAAAHDPGTDPCCPGAAACDPGTAPSCPEAAANGPEAEPNCPEAVAGGPGAEPSCVAASCADVQQTPAPRLALGRLMLSHRLCRQDASCAAAYDPADLVCNGDARSSTAAPM